jgi:membrane protease YdiL (CAAX protease family)
MRPNGSTPERPFPLAAAVAVTAAGIVAMVAGSAGLALRSGLGLRAQIAVGTLTLAFPAVAVLLLRPDLWPAVRGARRVAGRTIGLSLLLGAALWLGSAGLMEVQSLMAPPPAAYLDAFRAIHQALAPSGPLDALVSVLVIAVLPGVCEELVVRGVFLPSLAHALGGARGAWLAILVSAVLFAAIHLDPYRLLFTFALGAVFGFVRLRTGSLVPPVVAHAGLNTLTFVIAPFVDDPTQPYTPQPALGLACLLAGVAASWPLLQLLGRRVDSPSPRP